MEIGAVPSKGPNKGAAKKLELNEAGQIISDPKINDLAWREPRKGWGPLQMKVYAGLAQTTNIN